MTNVSEMVEVFLCITVTGLKCLNVMRRALIPTTRFFIHDSTLVRQDTSPLVDLRHLPVAISSDGLARRRGLTQKGTENEPVVET